MDEWLNLTILMAIQLYAVLNPVSVVPVYLSMTSDIPSNERTRITNNAMLVVLALLAVFSLMGELVLRLLNISVSGLKFGGGILLMFIALDTLGGMPRTKALVEPEELAVVPLATPLLVGPGTIATILVLSAMYPFYLVFLASMIAGAATYLTMLSSELLFRLMGRSGTSVLARIMSIVLAAFAADMIHSALIDWGIAK